MNKETRGKREPDLRRLIQSAIASGRVVDCANLNARKGRCNVALGLYPSTAAEPSKRYALFSNGEKRFFADTPTEIAAAADAFIRRVGQRRALAAYRELETR